MQCCHPITRKKENLAEGFQDVFAAINSYIHTPVITINGDNYSLEFFMCRLQGACNSVYTL